MSHPYLRALSTLLISLSLSFSVAAADKAKTKSSAANQPSYELPQPQRETLDLAMYQQIRDEGLAHSHVMQQCPPRGLGRVRHGMAATQYRGAHDLARYRSVHRAGRPVVSGDEWRDHSAGHLD